PDQLIQLPHIEIVLPIMLPAEREKAEPILIRRHGTVFRLIEVDEAALHHEDDLGRLGRILGDDERMRFTGRLVDERSGFADPVMLQISPMAFDRVTAHRAGMIVNAELRARQSLEKNAEASGGQVETARLQPNARRIGHPAFLVVYVDIGDEMAALALIGPKAIVHVAECRDRHVIPLAEWAIPLVIGGLALATQDASIEPPLMTLRRTTRTHRNPADDSIGREAR